MDCVSLEMSFEDISRHSPFHVMLSESECRYAKVGHFQQSLHLSTFSLFYANTARCTYSRDC